jgi:hypothetical protein
MITWTESRYSWTAHLAPGIELLVWRPTSAYGKPPRKLKVKIFNQLTLIKEFDDLETAQAAAIRNAYKYLKMAIGVLNTNRAEMEATRNQP